MPQFQTQGRRSAIVLTLASVLAAAPAHAQSRLAEPVFETVSIDGPAPPVPPATTARDADGRVTVRAVRVDRAPTLDGRLDEALYRDVPAITGFIQQEPLEGAPATEATEVWVSFDDDTLYVAARCSDSDAARMVVNEMRRDNSNIYQNENFVVVLDTYYDRRNAFLFQTNPLGGLRDGLVTDERDHNVDWSTVWDVRTERDNGGWTLEMAIPFKSLRYRPGPDQVWGINFLRVVRWKNELSHLTAIPASYGARGVYKMSSAATLVGVQPGSSSGSLEIKPFATAGLRSDQVRTPPVSNDLSGDVGLDAKYGITKSLTADFTVNTDFAQVEEDEQQVNLTRFSLFFPEKREFFLEGQGIFTFGGVSSRARGGSRIGGAATGTEDTPILFFSRQIGLSDGQTVPIRAGGRLTGRAGPHSIGALGIRTGAADAGPGEPTTFGVVRVRRDILRRSGIGFIGTHRSASVTSPGSNTVGGVDASFAFHETWTIDSYYARSQTSGRTGDDTSYLARIEQAGDRYGFVYQHLLVGEDFNPEVGFVRRTNFRRNFASVRFSPRLPGSPTIRQLHHEALLDYVTDTTGTLETRVAQAAFGIDFENGDQWEARYVRDFEFLADPFEIASGVVIPVGAYTFQDVRLLYQLGAQRRLSGRILAAAGSFFGGDRQEVGYSGRVEVTPQVSVEPAVSFNRVDLPEGRFTTRLLRARAVYTLSPRAFMAALVQHNSASDVLSANIRLRWEYTPGSELFVVYSEALDTGRPGAPATDNRGLVFKITRLLRF